MLREIVKKKNKQIKPKNVDKQLNANKQRPVKEN